MYVYTTSWLLKPSHNREKIRQYNILLCYTNDSFWVPCLRQLSFLTHYFFFLFFFCKYLVLSSISSLLPGITFSFPTWDQNHVPCINWIHSQSWVWNVNVVLSTTSHILIHANHLEDVWSIIIKSHSSLSSLPFFLPQPLLRIIPLPTALWYL